MVVFFQHVNKLSGNIDAEFVLSRAESICLKLQQKDDLPDHIKDLISHPDNPVDNASHSKGNQDRNNVENTSETAGTSVRTTDEAVVELVASTQSVF